MTLTAWIRRQLGFRTQSRKIVFLFPDRRPPMRGKTFSVQVGQAWLTQHMPVTVTTARLKGQPLNVGTHTVYRLNPAIVVHKSEKEVKIGELFQ